jgi:hypothetical protein
MGRLLSKFECDQAMIVMSKRDQLLTRESRRSNRSIHAELPEDSNTFVTIPAGEIVHWRGDARDWRRVKVEWCGAEYLVSRSSWEAADGLILQKPNRRRL